MRILSVKDSYGVRTGHGKPGKSWNLHISFSSPGKSWKIKVIFGKLVTADVKATTK